MVAHHMPLGPAIYVGCAEWFEKNEDMECEAYSLWKPCLAKEDFPEDIRVDVEETNETVAYVAYPARTFIAPGYLSGSAIFVDIASNDSEASNTTAANDYDIFRVVQGVPSSIDGLELSWPSLRVEFLYDPGNWYSWGDEGSPPPNATNPVPVFADGAFYVCRANGTIGWTFDDTGSSGCWIVQFDEEAIEADTYAYLESTVPLVGAIDLEPDTECADPDADDDGTSSGDGQGDGDGGTSNGDSK